jgi:DNA-directed RNA polymerase specialized sigma54-like protein
MNLRTAPRQTQRLSQRQRFDLRILSLPRGSLPVEWGGAPELPERTEDFRRKILNDVARGEWGEMALWEELAGGLSEDGYLGEPVAAIAQRGGFSPDAVERARKILMDWEGRGLGCVNFLEFFRRQLGNFPDACLRRAHALLRNLRSGSLRSVLRLLRRRMGREDFSQILAAFADGQLRVAPRRREVDGAVGGLPDMIFTAAGDTWQITVPTALPDGDGGRWAGLRAALHRRRRLLEMIGEWLAARQDQFLRRGPEFLLPLAQTELADYLSLAPSTVSRAVRGKTLRAPSGQWPLAEVFSRGRTWAPLALYHRLLQLLGEKPDAFLLSDRRLANAMGERFSIDISPRRLGEIRRRWLGDLPR